VAIIETHPYWHVAKLVSLHPQLTNLCFSHYHYVPQSIVDDRDILYVTREQFLSENWMEHLLRSTPTDKELALHSKVWVGHKTQLHIPMVDLSTTARAHLVKLQTLIEHTGFGEFAWYSSGRSFHGYGNKLLNSEYWIKLMGALLLSNQKGMMPTVDPRWIGHRLLGGYSALRWTKNTPHYVNFPTLLPPLML
jgi:hypothetical protein